MKYINHKYGFIFTHLNKDLKIHYKLDLKFVGYNNFANPIYEINRYQVYINNKEPDILLYEMADKMSKSFYPFVFSMNENQTIRSIENFKEIINRCKRTEEDLRKYYVGDTAEKIINNFKRHYNDEHYLKNELENNIFYNILFFPSQKQLNLPSSQQTNFKFSIEGKAIKLPVLQKIEPLVSKSKKIKLNLLGLKNEDNVNTFEISYKLNESDNSIFSAIGKIEYVVRREKTSYELECYHINE